MGLLSKTQIRAAKPGPKESLLNDGGNLYLRVRPTGKTWIYRYMKHGKPIKLGMGHHALRFETSADAVPTARSNPPCGLGRHQL